MTLRNFRDMPRPAQLTVAAVGALLLFALLAAVWLMFLRTDYSILFSGLRAADAESIVAELESKKIPYRLAEGGTAVLVPADRADGARLEISGGEVPMKGQVGFELFNKSDMGLTDFAQKINYQRALQGELARTIMTIDSVDSARVHLSISEHSMFRDDRIPPTASVSLVPRPGHRITTQAVQGIQRLVANAVPELEPANVAVIGEDGGVLGNDFGRDSDEAPDRRFVEQKFAEKIREDIKGMIPAESAVSVSAGPSAGFDQFLARQSLRSDWGGRDFPIEVTIRPTLPLSPERERGVRAAALASLAPGRPGDSVTIDLASISPAPVPLAGGAAPVSSGTPPARDVSSIAVRAGLAAALFGIAAMALFSLMQRRTLSEGQRRRYVASFRSLLNEDGQNA